MADFNTPDQSPGRGDLEPDTDIDQLMEQLFGNSPTLGPVNFPIDAVPLITPKIPLDPEDSSIIDPQRLATAENGVSATYQLSKDNAEFFGAELLEIVKEQLPDGVSLEKPRFLGANREGILENGGVVVAVSFVLKDEDLSGKNTHFLPDPSVFEPRVEEEDPAAEKDQSPEVIYEVEDADPENPDAPRRLRQRLPQMSGNGRTVATLAAMNGNVEEVFEPVDEHARVILIDKGSTVEVQVVFGAVADIPDSVIDRLVATSPVESLELPEDGPAAGTQETAEQMYHRLKEEGKELYDIMPEMEAAGFSEEDVLPLLRAKGKRSTPSSSTPEKPALTAGDFPVEEVSHPFSFGRVKLDEWAGQYLESSDSYYPGAALTIRSIERLGSDSNVLSVTVQMPETENGTEVRNLTLEPTLNNGRIGFNVRHTETYELGEYIARRREELGLG